MKSQKQNKAKKHWVILITLLPLLGMIMHPMTATADGPEEIIQRVATQYNISEDLAYEIAFKESSLNPSAHGATYGIGLYQINPQWHQERMHELGVSSNEQLWDPYSNALVAMDYLEELFDKYEDPAIVLMTYNGGDAYANRNINQGVISDYANDILQRAAERTQEREGL